MLDSRTGAPNMWLKLLTLLGRSPLVCFPFSSEFPARGTDLHLVASVPSLFSALWISVTALLVQEPFCQFPVTFQWELFHRRMYFWCVYGERWVPHPTLLYHLDPKSHFFSKCVSVGKIWKLMSSIFFFFLTSSATNCLFKPSAYLHFSKFVPSCGILKGLK